METSPLGLSKEKREEGIKTGEPEAKCCNSGLKDTAASGSSAESSNNNLKPLVSGQGISISPGRVILQLEKVSQLIYFQH